jgi:hypothetical protein
MTRRTLQQEFEYLSRFVWLSRNDSGREQLCSLPAVSPPTEIHLAVLPPDVVGVGQPRYQERDVVECKVVGCGTSPTSATILDFWFCLSSYVAISG